MRYPHLVAFFAGIETNEGKSPIQAIVDVSAWIRWCEFQYQQKLELAERELAEIHGTRKMVKVDDAFEAGKKTTKLDDCPTMTADVYALYFPKSGFHGE